MATNKRGTYWGEARGVDETGQERGVSIYRYGPSFRLVDDTLREHVAPLRAKLDRENICREIGDVFHYRDIEIAFPQHGIDFRKRS